MRHAHGAELVRHGDRPRSGFPFNCEFREGIDDRREVGPGIAEKIFNAQSAEKLQIGLGRGFH